MSGSQRKVRVTFPFSQGQAFQWNGPCADDDAAVSRASRAWSGVWRLMGGDYEPPGLREAAVEDIDGHEQHLLWGLSRAIGESLGSRVRERAPRLASVEEPSRKWARSLLAIDPAIGAGDFVPRAVQRGIAMIKLNAPVGTIGNRQVTLGMSHDLTAAPETLDAVFACAMAVLWAKYAATQFDTIMAPANPLFGETGSATLRAAEIADVMERDPVAAAMAAESIARLGFSEISGAYDARHHERLWP